MSDLCTARVIIERICQLGALPDVDGDLQPDPGTVQYMGTGGGRQVEMHWVTLGADLATTVECDSDAYELEPGTVQYFERAATADSNAMWLADWRKWDFTPAATPPAVVSTPAEEPSTEPSDPTDADGTEGAQTAAAAARGFWASAIADPRMPRYATKKGAASLTAAIAEAADQTSTQGLDHYGPTGCLPVIEGPRADRVCGYLEPDTRGELDLYVERLDDGSYAVSGVSFYVNGGD